MALKELMQLSANYEQKQGMSEERLREQLPHLRKLISFFREYPDLFVDYCKGENSTFRFFYYQRLFIRIVMRHRYVYATYPRALMLAPKNFLANLFNCKNPKIFYHGNLQVSI